MKWGAPTTTSLSLSTRDFQVSDQDVTSTFIFASYDDGVNRTNDFDIVLQHGLAILNVVTSLDFSSSTCFSITPYD